MKRIVGSLVFVIALITGTSAALAAGHHHFRPHSTTTTQAPTTTRPRQLPILRPQRAPVLPRQRQYSTTSASTTTTSASTTTTSTPSSSSVAFVQDGDTGTFTGNTTSLGSGLPGQVLPHDTGIGHTVVLVIQTLTDPGTQTDTVTSISSNIGTFHFVNSYNDDADNEIWVCTNTTGAADTITVNTPTNAWNAFAIEFNAPATGVVDGGGQVFEQPALPQQSELDRLAGSGWQCCGYSRRYPRCLRDRACGTLDVLQLGVLVVLQRNFGSLAGSSVIISPHCLLGYRWRAKQFSGCSASVLGAQEEAAT